MYQTDFAYFNRRSKCTPKKATKLKHFIDIIHENIIKR